MENTIIKYFNSQSIRFQNRNEVIWVSLTDMAQATGKRVNDWQRLKSTTEYLQALESDAGIPVSLIIQTRVGGNIPKEDRGTWAIEELAIDFAQWCNVHFRIWTNRAIKEVIKEGGYISPAATPEQLEGLQNQIKELQAKYEIAIEDRDQMGFEYVTHIVKDVFGIPMKQYDRGVPVNKTYLQVLEGIEKHFNNLNLLGHNQVIESLSAKEKLLSSWVDECEHIQRCQLKTKWQRHHNFWKFVQFYISTRGKKKVREGLMNWLSHVNIG